MADRVGRLALLFAAGAIFAAGWWGWVTPLGLAIPALAALVLLIAPRVRIWAALPLGVMWFAGHAWIAQQDEWPAERAHETVTFSARVVGLPDQSGDSSRIEFEVAADGRAQGLPARVLLAWFWPREWFRPGEHWRLTARIEPPSGAANPGLFDYHRYLIARGIGAQGRIVAADRRAAASGGQAANRFRQRFADWLQAETASLDAAALHRALTVADRSAMAPELSDRLRRTGTAHLLSISGLHVGMVAGLAGGLAALLLTLIQPLLAVADRRRPALVMGLLAAFGYAALAGFSLPTQRALIMLVAASGALLLRRPLAPGRALLIALVAVLLLQPLAPLDTGFWLSFGAVAVLIWMFSGRQQRPGAVRGLLLAQLAVAVGLLPLNLGIFGQWAPTAWLANLIAIPLVGLWILPLLLIALLLFLAGLQADALVALAEAGSRALLWLLDALYRVDTSVAGLGMPVLPAPGLLALLLAAFGGLWLLAPRGWPLRGLGLVLLLPLLWPPRSDLPAGAFEVWVPDLGDGQAVLVMTSAHTLLFGTGPGDGADRHRIDSVIAPLLRQAGRRRVDHILAPGGNREFAGGLAAARASWPDARVQTAALDDPDRCREGQRWTLDGVAFEILHPSVALPDLGADAGCVLSVRSPFGSVLLPGNVGSPVWNRLLARNTLAPVDLLLLPRAGRADALPATALARLAPAYAVASVRAHDRRGRPEPALVERIEAAGGAMLRSGACGALRFSFDGAAARVVAERIERRRFWAPADACRLQPESARASPVSSPD
ncbi:MAG: DNA internalization-related competence protein ComEC/Rec2 [Wenzhouxiangellaceae bacterium]|nr:DNA internalization-related competence protein ComEC/Rec2 [Wenzhouxiangellaceae bacterium]